VQELAEAGVKRISLGSSLARAALGELMRAAREIRESGTFSFASKALPFAEVWRQMRPKTA
jgi:2-methylisocitrate lyase-like PEP mutase family enzyme